MKKIICFDLDDTLIIGNSSFRFYFYLWRKGILKYSSLPYTLLCFLRFRFFKLPLVKLHDLIFTKFLKGQNLKKMEEHVSIFLEKELSKLFYLPAIAKLKEAKNLGHLTVILSSSPNFLVRKVSEYLQVDRWFASQYATDDTGAFTKIDKVVLGEDKKTIVERLLNEFGLSQKEVEAYSDSVLDLPLLLSVGKPVAVRPDPVLTKISKKHQWDIL